MKLSENKSQKDLQANSALALSYFLLGNETEVLSLNKWKE